MALIGVFMNLLGNDPEISMRRDSLLLGLDLKGVQIAVRFGGGEANANYQQIATDLVGLNPAALVATCWPTMHALQAATSTIPIVFTGLVDWASEQAGSYAYGTNVTGFVSHESGHCSDWVTYLLQIAPTLTRIAVIYDPTKSTPKRYYKVIQSAAPSGVAVSPIDLTMTDAQLQAAIQAYANTATGLIVPTATLAATHRDLIISCATQYKLPAIYPNRVYTANGYSSTDNCGLISHGPVVSDYRNAGGYVSKILANRSAAFPPVVKNTSANFELVINLNAAAAIGLNVPSSLLNQADWLICQP
jgi:putative tryptophan/tyrosine transport system substrate-binding protein